MDSGKVFLCYRREDTAGYSGRIYDRLNARFPGRVFMDVKGIGIGTEWAKVIEQVLQSCRIFVPLIGKHWLDPDESGTPRLLQQADPLRSEIATAVRLRMCIIPVLAAGGTMPRKSDLPPDIAALTDWQALRVDDDDFDHDAAKLIAGLETELGEQPLEQMDVAGETGRKQAEIARLMKEAEAASVREDWVGAVQLLQSVLSLDRNHAEAAWRLREARDRQTCLLTYQEGQRLYGQGDLRGALCAFRQVRVQGGNYRDVEALIRMVEAELAPPAPAPAPKRKSARKWAAVLAVVFLLAIAIGYVAQQAEGNGRAGNSTAVTPIRQAPLETAAQRAPEPAQPVSEPAQPASEPPAAPREPGFAGDYVLASYVVNGIPMAVAGSTRIRESGYGGYDFTSLAGAQGIVFSYQGTIRRDGNEWIVQIVASNDPTVLRLPVRNRVTFDGERLTFEGRNGVTAVWEKQ